MTKNVHIEEKQVVKKFRSTIEDFLKTHPGTSEKWTASSCHETAEREITTHLLEEGLITTQDIVYVAGTTGMREGKTGFQIGISPKIADRNHAWFLWNTRGYDPTTENSGYLSLTRNDTYHF